jgi:hypothetical protein
MRAGTQNGAVSLTNQAGLRVLRCQICAWSHGACRVVRRLSWSPRDERLEVADARSPVAFSVRDQQLLACMDTLLRAYEDPLPHLAARVATEPELDIGAFARVAVVVDEARLVADALGVEG